MVINNAKLLFIKKNYYLVIDIDHKQKRIKNYGNIKPSIQVLDNDYSMYVKGMQHALSAINITVNPTLLYNET
jgi:hypothetical protein